MCEPGTVRTSSICNCGNCVYHHDKPEGIAVELIDAAIRMMDYLGHVRGEVSKSSIWRASVPLCGTDTTELNSDVSPCIVIEGDLTEFSIQANQFRRRRNRKTSNCKFEAFAVKSDMGRIMELADSAVTAFDPKTEIGSAIGMMHHVLDKCMFAHTRGEVSKSTIWRASVLPEAKLTCSNRRFGQVTCGEFKAWAENFLGSIFETVARLKCDPEQLLLEKHAYNIKRPYKHGKLF